MPKMLPRLALATLACVLAMPATAQLIERKDLSYAIAKTIAENALADCKARGYAVSVVVVDRGGDTIVQFLVDHGANLNAKTKKGLTPLDVAMGKSSLAALPVPKASTVALLRKLGGLEGSDVK